MERFFLCLACFGFSDQYIDNLCLSGVIVHKKGDIWRKRTGEHYEENILTYEIPVSYEEGFTQAFNKIIEFLSTNNVLYEIINNSNYVELQIVISTGEQFRVPQVKITPKQMEYFSKIRANIDVQIT